MKNDNYEEAEKLALELATNEANEARYIGSISLSNKSIIIKEMSNWHIENIMKHKIDTNEYKKIVKKSEDGARRRIFEIKRQGSISLGKISIDYLHLIQDNINNRVKLVETGEQLSKTRPKIKKQYNFSKYPWLKGIYESFECYDLIKESNIESKNRVNLIILDSTIEIIFKSYLRFIKKMKRKEIPKERDKLHKIIKRHIQLDDVIWDKIEHYYEIRNDLYHETASKTITDSYSQDFYNIIIEIIST